jgi:hypothetical protein
MARNGVCLIAAGWRGDDRAIREIAAMKDPKVVELVMSHGHPLRIISVMFDCVARGHRQAAISVADRALVLSFEKLIFAFRAVVRGGIPAVEMVGGRVEAWLSRNRDRSRELLLAYAMFLGTPSVESLAIARRAAEAGDWVAMLLLDELGAGADWRRQAFAAGAVDHWRSIEGVPPTGRDHPRWRIECAVGRIRDYGEGLRLVKKVARRRCLAVERISGPVTRSLVLHKFGKEREAAAAQRAELLLSACPNQVVSGSVKYCRRAETNAFLLMVAHGWTGDFHAAPPV